MLLAANVQTRHRIRPESRLPINWPGAWLDSRVEGRFTVDFTSRRIRWSGALPEGSNWKREHKFSLAEVLWYNIRHAGLHE